MIWFLSALVALSAATAPQQNRPGDQVTVGTATVSGRITDERTGLPISSVAVTISGTTRPADPQVTSDSEGQFVFTGIAAGRYSIAAKRGGYFDAQFGQRQPLGPGTTITLDDGERRTGIAMALYKPAAVTGTVLDDAGEPVVKLLVRAYARAYLGGRPHYAAIGTGVTDDRGVYRIGRLLAGDFIVGVPVTRPRGGAGEDEADDEGVMPRDGGAVSQLPPAGNGRAQVFPASYFPAGVAAPYATVVSLEFGDLRRNVDLQVRPAPAFRLSGSVQLPADAKRSARVRLTTVDEDPYEGGEIASMAVSDAGMFAIGGIPPGQYMLKVETPEAWAAELISIADADMLDIRLQMHGTLRVTGRLAFDGNQPDPDAEAAQQIMLSVERADGTTPANKPDFSIERTGRNFVISGLMPGRYVVRMDRGAPNWLLRSVTFQGRDVSQSALEVTTSDVIGLTATFTDRISSVTGNVSGAGDTPDVTVFVFPQDQQRWLDFGSGSRGFRAITAGNGPFEVADLPAGDYIAVALAGDAQLNWRQPSFLQPAARVGTPLRVTEGAVTQVDLKVVVIR